MRSTTIAILACLALAGCAGPGAQIDTSGLSDAAEPATTALSARGTTSTYACAGAGPLAQCSILEEGDAYVPLEAPGPLASVDAEIAWAESSPATMWVWLVEKDGEEYDLDDPIAEEVGESPLRVTWDLSPYAGAPGLALVVFSMTYAGTPVGGAGAAPPVPFTLEGELAHEPSPDETTI